MTLLQAMTKGALALGAFALITAGSVAVTRSVTEERIEANRLVYQHRQLREVLPPALLGIELETLLQGAFTLPVAEVLGHAEPTQGWHVEHESKQALILPVVSHQGYSGEIHLLVGFDGQRRITGVRVTRHQETPGLGDKIERRKSEWITAFEGMTLDSLPPSAWAVSKDGGDFDSFSGATITPRAVVEAVHRTLRYAEHHDLPASLEPPATQARTP
ncbi:electron transport complex subunit RsxG [Halomonas sp. Bachu 37]|uniref:electron transport complex subunit RsxG n=1 Tax=Halomonas kashgarensis TaxID=3084920 RepID=UPI003217888E